MIEATVDEETYLTYKSYVSSAAEHLVGGTVQQPPCALCAEMRIEIVFNNSPIRLYLLAPRKCQARAECTRFQHHRTRQLYASAVLVAAAA